MKEITRSLPAPDWVLREMQRDRHTKDAAGEGWVIGSTFFGSLMSGLLLGSGADYLFGTKPLWTVVGIIAGAVSGFYTMWYMLAKLQISDPHE